METQAGSAMETRAVTVADMDALVAELKRAREDAEEKGRIATEANKVVMQLEGKCVAYLKEMGRENYQTPDGTIYIINKWNVKVPATDLDKQQFFAFLQERGIFMKYATVNSQSLNSLYKTLVAEAEEKGELLSIPGIGAPTLHESFGMRKGKS